MDGSFGHPQVDQRWYAVKAQPRKEKLAELHLERQGFRHFLPKIARTIQRPSRTETIQAPFFPGYLFVSLSLARDRWRSVNGTIGVLGLVQFGDTPTPVPAGLIEGLIARASEDGEVRFDETFAKGDPVRLVGGAFDGRIGVFESGGPHERVTVLLELMSREVRVQVSKGALMAV